MDCVKLISVVTYLQNTLTKNEKIALDGYRYSFIIDINRRQLLGFYM